MHPRVRKGPVRQNAGTEFALVVPFLLLLLIGSIEIGRALRYYHVVKESLRDAARYLSRVPILISFSCSLVSDQRPAGLARADVGSESRLYENYFSKTNLKC